MMKATWKHHEDNKPLDAKEGTGLRQHQSRRKTLQRRHDRDPLARSRQEASHHQHRSQKVSAITLRAGDHLRDGLIIVAKVITRQRPNRREIIQPFPSTGPTAHRVHPQPPAPPPSLSTPPSAAQNRWPPQGLRWPRAPPVIAPPR